MTALSCPACGSPMEIHTSKTLFVTCSYCRTQSRRSDQTLERIGKVADLIEDASPLRLGTKGVLRGTSFELIGRLQYEYERGFWNEWHAYLENGKSAWLGEAQGTYSFMEAVDSYVSPYSERIYAPGKQISLKGRLFDVMDRKKATVTSGEGELPFPVRDGYETQVVDLANSKGECATLDFSENPPLVFIGRNCAFDELQLSNINVFEGWKP